MRFAIRCVTPFCLVGLETRINVGLRRTSFVQHYAIGESLSSIFGICISHLGMTPGLGAYRLPFGNRGYN
jgi:hypothetical protein